MAEDERNGQNRELRSRESTTRAFIEFHNKTLHPVDIFWINYTSGTTHYTTVKKGMRAPINTFVSHPWIAVSLKSKERMLLNNNEVFWPQPFFRFIAIRDANFQIKREEANITFGMRSLLNISKDAVVSLFSQRTDIESLQIPKTLKLELLELFKFFNDDQQPDEPIVSELQIIRG
jgi:hypothetical protein